MHCTSGNLNDTKSVRPIDARLNIITRTERVLKTEALIVCSKDRVMGYSCALIDRVYQCK